MADWFELHPVNPHKRTLAQVAVRLRQGAVIAYPTDSCYALGCQLDDKQAAERLRRIRQFDRNHQFTLVCRDLSEIATYARVDNWQYRLLKQLTPGPYTFVLPATKELPRRVMHDRRKTIGLRVPQNVIAQELLGTLGEPLISCTLIFPGESSPVDEPEDWRTLLDNNVDVVVNGGPCGIEPTTILDLSGEQVRVDRRGKGSVEMLGL
jgi:tRNA threonylcarbamoyl adenosine modification protein (Sua5/YciO/YrdC/YwlC family)